MILIDALYINNGGGKVLLEYLIEEFENSNEKVYYLIDKRIEDSHPVIKFSNTVKYIEPNYLKRSLFYFNNRNKFDTILCFGNVPPNYKCKAKVFTYFHQKMFLEIPKECPWLLKKSLWLKSKIVFFLKNNSDYWIVQTSVMKKAILIKLKNIDTEKVLIIPFYPAQAVNKIAKKTNNTFVYVSSGSYHKNHQKLIDGFRIFYQKNNVGELHITVEKSNIGLNNIIYSMINLGIPIVNHGFVSKSLLKDIYAKATFSIFPSLSESFGLGIIEAIENNCLIIGSDLPYTHAVCEPSVVFDPTSIESIAFAFEKAISGNIVETKQIVFNDIQKIIELIKK
jgi:glycosyltransferase involved in cell wall biosynthesis